MSSRWTSIRRTPHPPLRPARQRHAGRQHRPSARTAHRAGGTVRGRRYQPRRSKPAQAARAPVSVLRRPHGHHRDVRALLLAAPSAGGILNRDQDRHLMIAAMGGNTTDLRINFAGSRPATKSLAVTATSATVSSTNRRSTPLLPIAGVRSSPPTSAVASTKRVQRTLDTHRQRRNPHSV